MSSFHIRHRRSVWFSMVCRGPLNRVIQLLSWAIADVEKALLLVISIVFCKFHKNLIVRFFVYTFIHQCHQLLNPRMEEPTTAVAAGKTLSLEATAEWFHLSSRVTGRSFEFRVYRL